MNYRIERAARQELWEAGRWYPADGGTAVAEHFERTVQRALDMLLLMPKAGRPQLRRHLNLVVEALPLHAGV